MTDDKVDLPRPGDRPRTDDLPRTDEQWRARLNPEEFRVLRQAGTERPWSGEYVETTTVGTYHCRACDAPLFTSDTKFDSHCGWPSFDEALPGAVRYIEDRSHGMVRTEVRCATCDSHLGHRFDGERYTSKNARYCMNSVALRLEPA
ncbi:peptide-methionine (R)-S-oxide reductase MsrB [Solwaraspora sp. WMMD791]|uniref:peptide-methionine (R)-S-oxide reductase MsrB n=1 Tax=Solwaraspora sp. WMMD791 TaxID=3016086 RepID=UPI00249C1E06|nr:peptide-methionine (R)-S-oxide reductase MsrB [Solwaraspora sp. WMMD791]WFE27567.1 peptide-methionine (R)-S-oxide reductase MsrB [Solwaraspora sp. WMMD791]